MPRQNRVLSPMRKRPQITSRDSRSSPTLPKVGRKSSQWSAEDDRNLKDLRAKGKSWQEIVETGKFEGKTDNACRKRHERMCFMDQKDEVYKSITPFALSQAYMESRIEMFMIMAERLGIQEWEVLEQKVFETGVMTMRNIARGQQSGPGTTENDNQSQVADMNNQSRLQTPPSTDEEEIRYGQNGESQSRGSTPSQQASPLPIPSNDQVFKPMYYGHPHSFPAVPNQLPYSTPSRDIPHAVQQSYPHPMPFTLPAMQTQEYGAAAPPQRPMAQPNEYDMTIRYNAPPASIAYERGTMPSPAYHHQPTPPTKHEDFGGMKISVQSMLSEPTHMQDSYN